MYVKELNVNSPLKLGLSLNSAKYLMWIYYSLHYYSVYNQLKSKTHADLLEKLELTFIVIDKSVLLYYVTLRS